MTALFQALGLPAGRVFGYVGKCAVCGRRWRVDVVENKVVGLSGGDSGMPCNGMVELGHGCMHGRRVVYLRRIRATINKGVRCGARCTHAVGHECECSCGGRNHGRG